MNNLLKDRLELPKDVKRIHCIGIGGSGMFPIVQILHGCGYEISGSDNNETDIVNYERKMGINVIMGQRAENIEGADMIMYTAAIMDTNPELIAARASGKPLYERAEILGIISRAYETAIGVTGTHGKTTVTSMLTQIMFGSGIDVSAVIGGKLKKIDGYGRMGKSPFFVYEACEFRDHFLKTTPETAVILNIDNDHMEYFGTVANAMKSYTIFANSAKRVIYNISDENTKAAMENVTAEKTTFGWDSSADYYPVNIGEPKGLSRKFTLCRRGEVIGEAEVSIPGIHNVLNAVAALAAALENGVDFDDAVKNLKEFHGAGRRFEKVGEHGGYTVVDDYAHHPREIMATLKAAKELDFKRVWAVFQPFTFSRTYLLLNDFAEALSVADKVLLTPIMGSREVNEYGIKAEDLGEKIEGAVCFDGFESIAEYVKANAGEGDLILTLGCGDVYKCARMML